MELNGLNIVYFFEDFKICRFLAIRYVTGTINRFKSVELKCPPRMTFVIGLCISLPGSPPANARGISASPAATAAIRIGLNLSTDPTITVLCRLRPWKSSSF